MKYKIKISYQTGDSFGSEDTVDYLELTWDNLENAKENLQRIKEHYNFYKSTDYYRGTRKDYINLMKSMVDKPWFVNEPKLFHIISDNCIDEKHRKKCKEEDLEYRPDDYAARYRIKFKADTGKEMQIGCFWCGHFEKLYSAEIEVEDESMKIVFD